VSGPFGGRRIALGISGSIAAYKAADFASKLTQAGALVDVLLTKGALEFVTPLTFRSLTHRPVITDLFDINSPDAVEHVAIARDIAALIVAPATAQMITKVALGIADDPLSVTALATNAPLMVAPAMDAGMWDNAAVRAHIETLRERGALIAGPGRGRMASGLHGWGRLLETAELLGYAAMLLGRHGDLAGRTIVVSAGGTSEAIDPVRVITNRSSGKMGYAIAEAARNRGARVVLVTSAGLPDPVGMLVVRVESAAQMRDAVLDACDGADALIMAAAVADYRPAAARADKVKKEEAQELRIDLVRTPDILSEAPRDVVRVGFAAESRDLLANARAKVAKKQLDLIVANDITVPNAGFGAETNKVTLIDRDGNLDDLPLLPKYDVAMRLLDRVAALLSARVGKRPHAGHAH